MAQLSVKVYLVENKVTKEIRKFAVDVEVAENFDYLVGKIRQVFPSLLRKDLALFWKDDEEDFISISSDDELRQALKAIPPNVECLKIFVKDDSKSEKTSIEHPGITCDGCDSGITGKRYKCTVCHNFDLCSSCESKGSHPDDHELLCIKKPKSTNFAFFEMRPSFGGCHRGRGFRWRRGGPCGPRGAWGSAAWSQRGRPCEMGQGIHFGNRFDARNTDTAESQKCHEKQGQKDASSGEEQSLLSMVKQFAVMFGLDPDVAEAQFHSFFDQENARKSDGKEKEQELPKELNEMLTQLGNCFGVDPEQLRDTAKSLFPHNNQEREGFDAGNKKEVQNENEESKGSEMETDDNQSEGASKNVNESPKPEDFILLDNTDTENLTEEQKYEKRLGKAIKQMEAMGFDNDGGWLRQLLISKDLSIGKVLDALNPAN